MNTPPVAPVKAATPVSDDGETGCFRAGADGQDCDLGFLEPPSRVDSLGRLRHYELLEVVGKGGFGIVFRAFDDVLQRVVAIKVLSPQMATTSPARKRFLREARAAAQMRHENVVQIYAVEEQPLPFLVMEFVPGETLQQRLTRTGPFDATEVAVIGRQIADGLAAAHAAGLIHRDVKPGNVLIEEGSRLRLRLTDFGLARAADDASLTQSGAVLGTPLYMSPEQAAGAKLDHRTDLFSLGSVLYTITTGRPPFRAESTLAVIKRVAEDKARSIAEVIPETPTWLCRVIACLMAKGPAERFQTAEAVSEALVAGPAAPTVVSRPFAARRLLVRASAVLTVVGGAMLAVYLATRVGPSADSIANRSGQSHEVAPATLDQKPAGKDSGSASKPNPGPDKGQPDLQFKYSGLRGGAISPDGSVLAASISVWPGPGLVGFWDIATGKALGPPLLVAEKTTLSLAFSHDGKRLATVSFDRTLAVWDVVTQTKLHSSDRSGPCLRPADEQAPPGVDLCQRNPFPRDHVR